MQREMEIRIGETGLAFYEAYNPTDVPVAGTASYNVSPDLAGYYFSKIECFCFNNQQFAANEQKAMPLQFIVDPELPDYVDTITLQYTFFDTAGVVSNNQ